MNYEEILMWVQENLISLTCDFNEKFTLAYIDEAGITCYVKCDNLVAGVLRINECDLT